MSRLSTNLVHHLTIDDGSENDAVLKDNKNFNVKLCPVCNECWQYSDSWREGKKTWGILNDFPRLGQEKLTCPKCR